MQTKTRILSVSGRRGSNGFSGDMHPTSGMYKRTMKCMNDLKRLADKDGVSVNMVAEKVLTQSEPELDAYIRSRNEVPVDTINGKMLQAALLRMEDISSVARAGGMSESDACAHVFQAESEAYNQNTAEKGKILTPSTQAAIMVVYNQLMSDMKGTTGVDTMGDALDLVRQTLQTPKDHTGLPSNFSWGSIPNCFDLGGVFSSDTGTTAVDPNSSLGGLYSEDTSSGTTPSTNNAGDSSSSVWDLISNVVKNAGSISSAIAKIGGAGQSAVNGIGSSITGIGSNIGSQSISKYISANWVSILIFLIVLALIIIAVVRASKH